MVENDNEKEKEEEEEEDEEGAGEPVSSVGRVLCGPKIRSNWFLEFWEMDSN